MTGIQEREAATPTAGITRRTATRVEAAITRSRLPGRRQTNECFLGNRRWSRIEWAVVTFEFRMDAGRQYPLRAVPVGNDHRACQAGQSVYGGPIRSWPRHLHSGDDPGQPATESGSSYRREARTCLRRI